MEQKHLKGYPEEEEISFAGFIRSLGDQLLAEPGCDISQLEGPISSILNYLNSLLAFYSNPSPPCTETIRVYMLQVIDMYKECLQEIRAFADDRKPSRISRSLALAEEAEDIMKALEIVIDENAAALGLQEP
jgi:hypothetical protein